MNLFHSKDYFIFKEYFIAELCFIEKVIDFGKDH